MGEMTQEDRKATALGHFKDWSNYLLVTSVAAVGWVAEDTRLVASCLGTLCLWSLALSVIFGIFTLALIPLVAEQMRDEHPSFQAVNATFRLLGVKRAAYIWQACRPQHIFFILGILFFVLAQTGSSWHGLLLSVGAASAGGFLWTRPDFFRDRAE